MLHRAKKLIKFLHP